MNDVFISYSRLDSEMVFPFLESLQAGEESADYDIWIDHEDIEYSVDWWQRIQKGIDEANHFVLFLSSGYVASEVCNQELQRAFQLNKKVIPIWLQPITEAELQAALKARPWSRAPKSLAEQNYIRLMQINAIRYDLYGEAHTLQALRQSLREDIAHKDQHTALIGRALRWEENQQETSFLLNGTELENALRWLEESAGKTPEPTELHLRYIQASRTAQNQRNRRLLGASLLAAVISLLLAIIAGVQSVNANNQAATSEANAHTAAFAQGLADERAQTAVAAEDTAVFNEGLARDNAATAVAERDRADEQTRIAISRQLAAQARLQLNSNLQEGTLRALTAFDVAQTNEARTALAATLIENPQLSRLAQQHTSAATALNFNADGSLLLSGDNQGVLVLWDVATGQPIARYVLDMGIIGAHFITQDEWLITTGLGRVLHFNRAENTLRTVLEIARNELYSEVAFSRDYLTVVFASNSSILERSTQLRVFRRSSLTDSFKAVATHELTNTATTSLVLSGDGRVVTHTALRDTEAEISIWDWERDEMQTPTTLAGEALTFSVTASATQRGAIFLLPEFVSFNAIALRLVDSTDLETVRYRIPYGKMDEQITHFRFDEETLQLVVGTNTGFISAHDAATATTIMQPIRAHTEILNAVALAPIGGRMASAAASGRLAFFDVARTTPSDALPTNSGGYSWFAASQNRVALLSPTQWSFYIDGEIETTNRAPIQGSLGIALDSTARRVAVAHPTAPYVSLFARNDDGQLSLIAALEETEPIEGIELDADWLVTRTVDDVLRIYDSADGSLVQEVTPPLVFTPTFQGIDTSMAFSPSGNYFAASLGVDGAVVYSVNADGTLTDERSYTIHAPNETPTDSAQVVMIDDDGTLTVGYLNGLLVRWRRDGSVMWRTEDHNGLVSALDQSIAHDVLLSASPIDRTLRLWDPATGTPLSPVIQFDQQPLNIAVGELNERPVAYVHFFSQEEQVRALPIAPVTWQQMACDRAGMALTLAQWNILIGEDAPYRVFCERSQLQQIETQLVGGDVDTAQALLNSLLQFAQQQNTTELLQAGCFYADTFALATNETCTSLATLDDLPIDHPYRLPTVPLVALTTDEPQPITVAAVAEPNAISAIDDLLTLTEFETVLREANLPFSPLYEPRWFTGQGEDRYLIESGGVIRLADVARESNFFESNVDRSLVYLLRNREQPTSEIYVQQANGTHPDAQTWVESTIFAATLGSAFESRTRIEETEVIFINLFGSQLGFLVVDDVLVTVSGYEFTEDDFLHIAEELIRRGAD